MMLLILKGHKYSMYIVLPQGQQKVEDMIKKINPSVINKQLWLMQELPGEEKLENFLKTSENQIFSQKNSRNLFKKIY